MASVFLARRRKPLRGNVTSKENDRSPPESASDFSFGPTKFGHCYWSARDKQAGAGVAYLLIRGLSRRYTALRVRINEVTQVTKHASRNDVQESLPRKFPGVRICIL